jgi:glycosyltransferase involved in cell wall biosynthesis
MRIGLQATNIFFEGPKHAGVSRTSLNLLNAILLHTEHHYVIFVRHDSPIPDHWLDMDHVTVVRAWAKTRSWHWLGRDLEPIKHKLDAWFSVSGFVPRTPGLIKGSLVHDTFWRKYPQTYTPEDIVIHEKMARNIAKYSTFIACNSESTAHDFGQTYGIPADRFVPLRFGTGQDIDGVTGDLPRPESLPTSHEYLFSISTLEPRKNLPMLFEAFAKIQDSYPQLDLVIAGAKGWKTDGIANRIETLGLSGRVHFLGFVPDADVAALFQHCRVAVTASLEEGFGVPVLEAMTFGAVVAASNSPAIKEVGGDVPIYFDPSNSAAIAAGLLEALSIPDRDIRIAAGKERSKLFSWANSAQTLLQRIESLRK